MGLNKNDINFSGRTIGLSEFATTFPTIIFAQLIALGYSPSESAWCVYFGFNKIADDARCRDKAEKALASPKVKALIEHFKKEVEGLNDHGNETIDELISRKVKESGEMDAEATAAELLRIANGLPDGKERADLMMKYADLKGFKKAGGDTKADKRQVAFFLPAQCHSCPCRQYAIDHGSDAKPLHSSKK